ncbi:unnamed protein product [Withania somnifera]
MNQGSGKSKVEQKQVEIVKNMMRCKDYKHACSQTQAKSTLDASCALELLQEQKEEHENHIEHDLNYEIKEDHICIVCGIKNSSFRCKDCEYWIHDECKVLREKYKCNHDDHILSLFFLPEEYRIRKLCCDVCHEQLRYVLWVYYCRTCRLFVHINCADKKSTTEENVKPYSKFNMVQLPVANAAVKLTSRFLKQNGLLTIPRPEQIANFHNNEHLLLLSSSKTVDELVCDGCIEPIVDEYYYSCQQCSYFLHDTCSQLPSGLELSKHPSHDDQDHQLHINHPKYFFSVAKCSQCQSETNGWSFVCRHQSHQFLLDLKCTFIPTDIVHKAHKHPLTRNSDTENDSDCNACGKSLSGSASYGCSDCHFYLGIECALLPPKIIHKWDEHPLLLMYPPFPLNPDDFLCEICEEYIHPKHWVYHCKECDLSFHPYCISRLSENRNIKFGGSIEIAEHNLKLVERGKYKSQCGVCKNRPLDKENALQCTKCDLHICRKCALYNLDNKKMKDVTTISHCNGILADS